MIKNRVSCKGFITILILFITVLGINGKPVNASSQEYFLSDLEWINATHGDADSGKNVQKDKPFSKGNDGQDTKIKLEMEGGEIKTFDKGLGTIASNPSTISYNITGAEVSHFSTYLGVDQSANPVDPRYAHIEKFEIVVDGEILYSTIEEYPDGVGYEIAAIKVDLEIPEGAKLFELKSYAGEETWGDEAVFANALFKATGEFPEAEEIPEDWEPADKRREVSNEQPLLMMPLYAHGPKYEEGEYAFWGDDTLIEKWELIPDELKPYSVLELHPDDLPKNATSAADFYEHFLEIAQSYVNPKTNKNEPIPVVLTVYTAGNEPHYTAAHWLTSEWIDEMYEKYSALHGLFSTESYWVWTATVESNAAEYLKLSAKHGGYFIWAEQNNGASIEKAFGNTGKTVFKNAAEKYWENFIFMYKNTPAAGGEDAPTSSYMTGLWLTDYAYQWGGLMDTWKWYETGKWKLFENSNIGQTQGNRQWLTEPEAMLGMEALNIYLNGGSVYTFEHPAYTYGVKNEKSPLYENVIEEFFKYIVNNPAPSKEEMLNQTKVILHDNFSQLGGGNFFAGLNTEMAQSPLYTTGRYGNIPAVPKAIERSKIEQALEETDIEIIDSQQTDLSSIDKRTELFNGLYPELYQGDIFAQYLDQRWFVYNYKYNENVKQAGENMILTGTDDVGEEWTADITLEPHTYAILEGSKNKVNVNLNNYRVNKDGLWEGASNANEATQLPQLSKQDAIDWVYTNYINQTKDQEKRSSTIVINGLMSKPEIENVTGLEGNYEIPEIDYDAENHSATITILTNGYINFDVVLEEIELKEEVETEKIPYETKEEDDPTLLDGETKVKQEGKEGKKDIVYEVTYKNGKEINREVVSEEVTKEAVDEIILVGTKESSTVDPYPEMKVKEEVETEKVLYETKEEDDSTLLEGETKVKQAGKDGKKEIVYEVTYENGKEVSREKVSEEVMIDPVDEIILVGTKKVETERIEENSNPEDQGNLLPKTFSNTYNYLLIGMIMLFLGLFGYRYIRKT